MIKKLVLFLSLATVPFLDASLLLQKLQFTKIQQHKKAIIAAGCIVLLPFLLYHFPVDIQKSNQSDYSIYQDGDIIDNITDISKPVAYWFYGWGDFRPHQNLGKNFQKNGICVMPHFSDLQSNRRWKCYFGLDGDVLLALKSLSCTFSQNREKSYLLGRSRGSQTTLNVLLALILSSEDMFNMESAPEKDKTMLHVLTIRNQTLLKNAKITEDTRRLIIKQIKAGKIALFVPLLSPKQTMINHFGEKLGTVFAQIILPFLSRGLYKPDLPDALEVLETLGKYIKEDHKPMLDVSVYFAKSDWMTKATVEQQEKFINAFGIFNGKNPYYVTFDGGHIAVGKKALKNFVETIT